MTTHLVFLRDEPLDKVVAGRKRFEIRASFRGLACASVRAGELLYLKRVGGEVEAARDAEGDACAMKSSAVRSSPDTIWL